jgi:hypothetical protein
MVIAFGVGTLNQPVGMDYSDFLHLEISHNLYATTIAAYQIS